MKYLSMGSQISVQKGSLLIRLAVIYSLEFTVKMQASPSKPATPQKAIIFMVAVAKRHINNVITTFTSAQQI